MENSQLFKSNDDKFSFQLFVMLNCHGNKIYNQKAIMNLLRKMKDLSLDDFRHCVTIISNINENTIEFDNVKAWCNEFMKNIEFAEYILQFRIETLDDSREIFKNTVSILNQIQNVFNWLQDIITYAMKAVRSLKSEQEQEFFNKFINDHSGFVNLVINSPVLIGSYLFNKMMKMTYDKINSEKKN